MSGTSKTREMKRSVAQRQVHTIREPKKLGRMVDERPGKSRQTSPLKLWSQDTLDSLIFELEPRTLGYTSGILCERHEGTGAAGSPEKR